MAQQTENTQQTAQDANRAHFIMLELSDDDLARVTGIDCHAATDSEINDLVNSWFKQ